MKKIYRQLLYGCFDLGFHVVGLYRLSRFFFFKIRVIGPSCAVVIRHFMRVYSGCDISPTAIIHKSLKLPHPNGVVIGDGVRIEEGVKIWQQVTIGSHGKSCRTVEYPVIGPGVRIYAKASIIGNVSIGDSATIGAHSLVLCDVPSCRTAAGVPARILSNA